MVRADVFNIPPRSTPLFSSINEFQYIREIGEGAFSKVYEALHTPTGKKYAIKDVS